VNAGKNEWKKRAGLIPALGDYDFFFRAFSMAASRFSKASNLASSAGSFSRMTFDMLHVPFFGVVDGLKPSDMTYTIVQEFDGDNTLGYKLPTAAIGSAIERKNGKKYRLVLG
jgi:hypothetical protein